MKRLTPLREFNDARSAQAFRGSWRIGEKQLCVNGLACPECGEELYDVNPDMVLTSMPPQLNVACTNCVWKGFRYK